MGVGAFDHYVVIDQSVEAQGELPFTGCRRDGWGSCVTLCRDERGDGEAVVGGSRDVLQVGEN
ncbi:MAG: hypothetical protein ACLP01_13240, partial [Solirubrobacteraceae bacterium]